MRWKQPVLLCGRGFTTRFIPGSQDCVCVLPHRPVCAASYSFPCGERRLWVGTAERSPVQVPPGSPVLCPHLHSDVKTNGHASGYLISTTYQICESLYVAQSTRHHIIHVCKPGRHLWAAPHRPAATDTGRFHYSVHSPSQPRGVSHLGLWGCSCIRLLK